ncbi:MAG: hypothetical protein V4683_11995 [Bacteroidota bacterium]|jgi:hypothetical protein
MKKGNIIIVGCFGRDIGIAAAIHHVISKMQDVAIVSSVQDIKNQQQNDYFAKESLKLKCFDTPPLIELTNKKGKPFDEPKSKYINRPIKNYRR